MNEPTIAAITDRLSAQIPSGPDEITEALIAARDDVRALLGHIDDLDWQIEKHLAYLDERLCKLETPEIPPEPTPKNFGSTGAVIGSLFDELAALKGRVSALESHAVLSLIPEEARA